MSPLWGFGNIMKQKASTWFNSSPEKPEPSLQTTPSTILFQNHLVLVWVMSEIVRIQDQKIDLVKFLRSIDLSTTCPHMTEISMCRRALMLTAMGQKLWSFKRYTSGYGSIPINTIFRGMNIYLPAILMFTRGTRFWHTAILKKCRLRAEQNDQQRWVMVGPRVS